jgi:hypothetical protein
MDENAVLLEARFANNALMGRMSVAHEADEALDPASSRLALAILAPSWCSKTGKNVGDGRLEVGGVANDASLDMPPAPNLPGRPFPFPLGPSTSMPNVSVDLAGFG